MTRELKVFPNTPPNHLEEKTKIINHLKIKKLWQNWVQSFLKKKKT